MAKPAADVPLSEITAVLDNFGESAIKWTKKAQRAAVLTWRDNTKGPGVAVRFTHEGIRQYGFSARIGTGRGKRKNPYYVATGSFRDQVLRRKPQTRMEGADVVSRFTLFGGVLNLLGNVYGMTTKTETVRTEVVKVRASMRRTKSGASPVSSYTQTRKVTRTTGTQSSKSYAEEIAIQPQDTAFLKNETERRLREIIRKAAFKKDGTLRESFREEMRMGVLR